MDLEDGSSSETIEDDRQTSHDPHSLCPHRQKPAKLRRVCKKERTLQTRKQSEGSLIFKIKCYKNHQRLEQDVCMETTQTVLD